MDEQFFWDHVDRSLLCQLVRQLQRFNERPYIEDEHALEDAIACGTLERSLEGDFCWSLCFTPDFLAALCYEGFLPICCELGGGTGLFVLLPKLHAERCVLRFADMHISRRTRRHAKQYTLTISEAFDDVLKGCIAQHGTSSLPCQGYHIPRSSS